MLVYRCFLGSNSGPAQWPHCNRYVEAIVSKLCDIHPAVVRCQGSSINQWSLVIKSYKLIREKNSKQCKGDSTDEHTARGDQPNNLDSVVRYPCME